MQLQLCTRPGKCSQTLPCGHEQGSDAEQLQLAARDLTVPHEPLHEPHGQVEGGRGQLLRLRHLHHPVNEDVPGGSEGGRGEGREGGREGEREGGGREGGREGRIESLHGLLHQLQLVVFWCPEIERICN